MITLIKTLCGLALLLLLTHCSASRKATAAANVVPLYEGKLAGIMQDHCSPCHYPALTGKKKPYDNYAAVKTDIDEIIRRISLPPGEKGFMPFKQQKALPDSVITMFRAWREGGMPEK